MKKTFLLSAALLGLVAAAPAQAFTPARVMLPNASFIVAQDSMPAEAWKPGDEVRVAQVGFGGMFPGPGTVHSAGGGGGYSGQGDLKAYLTWWGLYAYSAADRGTAAVNVCNASDANCADLSTDATTGLLNVSGTNVGANPCNDSTNVCTIKTWYNKGSTGSTHNLTQNTIGNRATLQVTCSGISNACAVGSSGDSYVSTNTLSQSQPYATVAVSYRNTSTSTEMSEVDGSGFDMAAGSFSANDQAYCQAGGGYITVTTGVNDGAWHGKACDYDGSSSNVTIDTTNTSGTMGTSAISGNVAIMSRNVPDRSWQGMYESGGIAGSKFSTSDLAAATAAAKTILGY